MDRSRFGDRAVATDTDSTELIGDAAHRVFELSPTRILDDPNLTWGGAEYPQQSR